MCVRYQTPFLSRRESGPSWFLSTGKHPVVGQLPRVSFSALPWQSSDRPSLPPHKKTFDFSVSFRQYSESTLRSMQWTGEAKNRSFNVQTVKVRSFRGPPSRPSFSTGSWSSCIVTGHDQSMHCPLFSRPSLLQCMHMQCTAECDQATARAVCRKCFMFHLDRDRSRASIFAGGAIMLAIDRKCFDCKQTTPSTGSASVAKLHS